MNTQKALLLLERLASLLRTETRTLLVQHGLQPVQFEALYYLSICNRYSDTPKSVTEYLGQTKGTVSQTLKVLERKGLMEKITDEEDRRVAHLRVTKLGHQLVANIRPSPIVESAAKRMSENDKVSLETSLHNLLRNVQQANNFKTFGQCATCSHNIEHSPREFTCGLTKEALSCDDIQLICREHQLQTSAKHLGRLYSPD